MPERLQKGDIILAGVTLTFPRSFHKKIKNSPDVIRRGDRDARNSEKKGVLTSLALEKGTHESIWMNVIFARDGAVPWCLHDLLFIQQKVSILENGSIRCRL